MAKIRKTGSTKLWWGSEASGFLTYCWWNYKLIQ